jgi:hypothetical protein
VNTIFPANVPLPGIFADAGRDVIHGTFPEFSPFTWGIAGVCCFFFFWLLICLAFAGHDKSRVRENLQAQGATVVSLRRNYLLMDWFVEREFRSYHVHYRDRNGWEHGAVCKTTRGGAIFYADDKIVSEPNAGSAPSPAVGQTSELDERIRDLEAENRRLKEELRRVKEHSPQ